MSDVQQTNDLSDDGFNRVDNCVKYGKSHLLWFIINKIIFW